MKEHIAAFMILSSTAWGSALFSETNKEQQITSCFQRIEKQQQALRDEIQQLKVLCGLDLSLDDIKLRPVASAPLGVQKLLQDAAQAYDAKKYEDAKKLFHDAWEQASDSADVQYNLAMAYYRLGNLSLAKKMFQSALKIDAKLPQAQLIESFVNGKELPNVKLHVEEESEEIKNLRTELLNKQKEANSYVKSSIPFVQKLRSILILLDEIKVRGQNHDALVRDYFLWLAENYAAFEYYTAAIEILKKYEQAMCGKELPDGYHLKKLQLQQQQQEQQKVLQQYIHSEVEPAISQRLQKDQEELSIFATQMDQFVTSLDKKDPDFTSLCHRLKEFRWGKKSSRHVLVIDRYQNILFSSLPGTLSLERYQDVQGRKFFRDITLLYDQLSLKQVEFIPIGLQVNNAVVPYVILYTYIPKHEAFIIVRLLKSDLNATES